MTAALINYDEGRRRIALANTVDEVADIRDKAQALTLYARQAKDTELLGWVSEIKVRAERRAGELIAEQQKNGELVHGGDRKSRSQRSTLKSEGITKSDSSRWQKIAGLSAEKFENALATAKDHIGEVTTAFVLREAKQSKPQAAPRSNQPKKEPVPLWKQHTRDGQLCRFYTVVQGSRAILELEMTPAMWLADSPLELRHAIAAAITPAIRWLSELKEIVP